MRVAVATIDGLSMSQHFGQSAGFVVFEVDGGNVKSRELRTNDRTPHGQGLCDGQHGQGQHAQSHGGVVDLLKDCDTVLCGGMGAGAAQALNQYGIQAVVLPVAGSAEEALSHYLNGTAPAVAGFCNCQH